jgi:large subunit ribosomal protein L15
MGWGQVGQHRKHSQKGERKSGRHKHLWTYVQRYEPNYYGKKGFKTPQTITGQSHPNTINIQQLDELIDKQIRHKQITKKQGKPYIDLTTLGYQKLLAKGKLTKPALIKIDSYSETAAKKIQEAGGQIIGMPKEGKPKESPEEQSPAKEEMNEEPPKN